MIVVMPKRVAMSRLSRVRSYCSSRSYPGRTGSSAACPARLMPITAKSPMMPVASPVTGSLRTRPQARLSLSRVIAKTSIASRFSHALWAS